MAENNQQYKWRQRRQRNLKITIWILFVILLAAGGTFAYEGMKSGDPLNVAEKYFKNVVGVENYKVETGDRSLNKDNQFVQDYTFTYTADGKEVAQKINMVQQNEKKYGLFEQWELQAAGTGTASVDLIVPAGSQVLIDSVAPDETTRKEDDTLSPAAVCYALTNVDPKSKLQVNGLPFESYEGTLESSGTTLDIRDMLSVSDNAKVQMEELGKSMINELYTAAISNQGADKLGDKFADVPNKANLYKAITENLFENDVLQADNITFEGFRPTFGEVYYPGQDEESFIGIEMKLAYTCSYDAAETETETEAAEQESEAETEAVQKNEKEATFYFRYQDGNCTVTSAEIPGVI